MLPLLLASGSLAAPPSVGESTDPFALQGLEEPDQLPVVGGAPAPAGKWPDAVALYSLGGLFACTGTLIAPDVVLTAGHCQFALESVLVGTHDLRNGSGEPIAVASVTAHEDYESTFDVALVRLVTPVTTVSPRMLALDCVVEDYLFDGADVDVVGFGATDAWATEWTSALNEARTNVNDADCSDLSSGCYASVSPGGEVSAGGDGVDSCVGDSGGPLYLDTPEGPFLLGTTSRATVPAESVCGDGGIYVRADAVIDWIEAELGYPLARPVCDGWNHVPRPVAAPLEAATGGFGATAIDPSDADEDDTHRFEVIEAPEHGSVVEISTPADGSAVLLYSAPLGFQGIDRVVVRVTDDGDPPLSGELEIPIVVRPTDDELHLASRGCSTAPGAGGLALLGLAALVRRRRPRAGC